jgi:hypothetical protein
MDDEREGKLANEYDTSTGTSNGGANTVLWYGMVPAAAGMNNCCISYNRLHSTLHHT